MKLKLKSDSLRNIIGGIIPYFKNRTEQTIVISVLIIVSIAALLSSLLFYRFSINPKELTEDEMDHKKIEIGVEEKVLQKISADQETDQELLEEIAKINDPFK